MLIALVCVCDVHLPNGLLQKLIRLYNSNHETLHVSSCGAEAVATVCVPT